MKNRVTNKIRMYDTVAIVCTQNQPVWGQTPGFSNAFDTFTQKVDALKAQIQVQEEAIFGVTAAKREHLNRAVTFAVSMGRALAALAVDLNDQALLARNMVSKSDWHRGNVVSRIRRFDTLLDDVDTHSAVLGDYGVTIEIIDDLEAEINIYKNLASTPRLAIIDRKQATEAIDLLVKEIDNLLKGKMDRIVEVFKHSAPAFFKRYFNSRIVIDLKSKHSGSSGTINTRGYEE